MSQSVYDEMVQRGFIAQVTDDDALRRMLSEQTITFYVGFDSTAISLHAGSLVPLMAMMHLQRAGHKPIFLTGGGTTMIGDPTGRTEMRKLLSEQEIRANGRRIHDQVDRYFHFDGCDAIALDNTDWLLPLNYIAFLRDIGVHFSVNRMLAAEAYKLRMEKGLSFIEFNYQLLQAYDYLTLHRDYGCTLQMGGDDLLTIVDIDPNNQGNSESNRALLKTDRFDMPLIMRIGLSGEVFQNDNGRLTLAVEALNPNNSEQYINMGGEIGLLGDLIMFRGGYSELLLEDSVRSFTLGGGLRYRFAPISFMVDYAFEKNEYFSDVNRFTVTLAF